MNRSITLVMHSTSDSFITTTTTHHTPHHHHHHHTTPHHTTPHNTTTPTPHHTTSLPHHTPPHHTPPHTTPHHTTSLPHHTPPHHTPPHTTPHHTTSLPHPTPPHHTPPHHTLHHTTPHCTPHTTTHHTTPHHTTPHHTTPLPRNIMAWWEMAVHFTDHHSPNWKRQTKTSYEPCRAAWARGVIFLLSRASVLALYCSCKLKSTRRMLQKDTCRGTQCQKSGYFKKSSLFAYCCVFWVYLTETAQILRLSVLIIPICMYIYICLQTFWVLDIIIYGVHCGKCSTRKFTSNQSNVDKHVISSIYWAWISSCGLYVNDFCVSRDVFFLIKTFSQCTPYMYILI